VVFTDGHANVTHIDFSPNRIDFGVSSFAAARVYLNQRYVTGWRSNAGPMQIDPANGLAYVDIAAGVAAPYSFTFVTPGLVWGVALWLVGLGAGVVAWRRDGRSVSRSIRREIGSEESERGIQK
jgi:hypothetical protein